MLQNLILKNCSDPDLHVSTDRPGHKHYSAQMETFSPGPQVHSQGL